MRKVIVFTHARIHILFRKSSFASDIGYKRLNYFAMSLNHLKQQKARYYAINNEDKGWVHRHGEGADSRKQVQLSMYLNLN